MHIHIFDILNDLSTQYQSHIIHYFHMWKTISQTNFWHNGRVLEWKKWQLPSTFWLLCVQDIFPVYLQSFGAQIHSHYERCKISCGRWSAQSKHILKVGYPLSPLFVHLFRKCSFFKLLHMIPGILFHSSKMFEEIMIDCFLFVIEQWTNERLFSSTLHILVK